VALAFTIGVAYHERILKGIFTYARKSARRRWQFDLNSETGTMSVSSLGSWRGDGVIAMVNTSEEARHARALGVPVVNISGMLARPGLPTVGVDNHAVGALAARHFLERGMSRFAYYGLGGSAYGRERGLGFARAVRAAGFRSEQYLEQPRGVRNDRWRWDRERLVAWLSRLDRPVGIFAVHDYRARLLLETTAALGLAVPEEVAVLAVNDDPIACEYCDPPLSSIVLPGEEVGRQAAALLASLMEGDRPGTAGPRVLPTGVTLRRSSDTLAVADPVAARAAAFFEAHIADPVDVRAAAHHLGVSRRTLELRFHRFLHTTPRTYLMRLRIRRAKILLADAEGLRLKEIAARCGFGSSRRLGEALRQQEGVTPKQFRQSARR
jgi:LacI family transcriptional regulator